MGKYIVRIAVILTGLYMMLSYYCAQFLGIDILRSWYHILFELCVAVYCYSEGRFHCAYIKHLALAILLSDIITQIDCYYDVLTIDAHNLIPIGLLGAGFFYFTIRSLHHFYRVFSLKKRLYANKER